jgi:hypothetical protein
MPIARVPSVPPESLAMVRSDLPGAVWNRGGLPRVGTDHSHGRRRVPLAMPSVRAPAEPCDYSPLIGTA